jgi:hypothetical protein
MTIAFALTTLALAAMLTIEMLLHRNTHEKYIQLLKKYAVAVAIASALAGEEDEKPVPLRRVK